MWLLLRSLMFALLLPGTVTAVLPAAILASWPAAAVSARDPRTWAAGIAIAIGAAGLVRCIWEFAVRGRGTLAPVDPPTRLVVSGLYRYVRNPMYVSVVTILAGEALLWQSAALAIYAGTFLAITHAFILIHEEPALRNTFGASYTDYTRSVSRWIPRRPHAQ
jgi:protein-S-isoprenylcysteine O-methyltransferase Ste14